MSHRSRGSNWPFKCLRSMSIHSGWIGNPQFIFILILVIKVLKPFQLLPNARAFNLGWDCYSDTVGQKNRTRTQILWRRSPSCWGWPVASSYPSSLSSSLSASWPSALSSPTLQETSRTPTCSTVLQLISTNGNRTKMFEKQSCDQFKTVYL